METGEQLARKLMKSMVFKTENQVESRCCYEGYERN